MLAIGVGKGARALFNLARSGAKDLGAAVKASRVFRGLAGGARAVKSVVASVRTRISRLIGKAEKAVDDVGVVGQRADSRLLAEGMEARGIVRPAGDFEAHHIVAGGAKNWYAVQSRAILDKWRIGINSAENGVFLPATKAIAANPVLNPAGAIYHGATFPKNYYRRVYEMLSQARSQDEALFQLDRIRSSLLSGALP